MGSTIADLLARAGVIAPDRLHATTRLAWPRIVTGIAIMSKATVDLAMVGWAVGELAVAGLAFANAYWTLAKFAGIGVAGGIVALISQAYGANRLDRAERILGHGIIAATALSVPVTIGYMVLAGPLIGLFDPSTTVLTYGQTYLLFVAPGLVFEFWNLIASRTYAGVSDTVTPMVIRSAGAVLNIVLSAVLIFGAGLGVVGAALGTTLSVVFVTVLFSWGMTGRAYIGHGASPVALSRAGLVFDRSIAGDLLSVSAPLIARRTAETIVAFPLLWIASTFGPIVVAAYEVGRRVRALMDSFSWGFSIAASTLVGQQLGGNDETEAEAYGWGIIRLSAVVYVVLAGLAIMLAGPIAQVFVDDPMAVTTTAWFVIAAAGSVIFLGIDGSATGTLRGAGDTRFPFVSSVVGRYGFGLTAAVIGLLTTVGARGLLVGMLVETLVPALMNLWRVRSNRWKTISQGYREALTVDGDD